MAHEAQVKTTQKSKVFRPVKRLLPASEQIELVIALLRQRFSLEQIAGKLCSMCVSSFEDAYLCRETIYNAINPLQV